MLEGADFVVDDGAGGFLGLGLVRRQQDGMGVEFGHQAVEAIQNDDVRVEVQHLAAVRQPQGFSSWFP